MAGRAESLAFADLGRGPPSALVDRFLVLDMTGSFLMMSYLINIGVRYTAVSTIIVKQK